MKEQRCKIFHKIVNNYLYFPQAQIWLCHFPDSSHVVIFYLVQALPQNQAPEPGIHIVSGCHTPFSLLSLTFYPLYTLCSGHLG